MRDRQSILIVDDVPANLRLLTEILGHREYMVRPVTDGLMAIAAAQAEPPDLILLDIMMPNLTGYEACKRLKTDERTRDIPIIFISAKNELFDKVKAFTLGAVDYITKPFQSEEVLARVETHLALRSLQNRLKEQNAALTEALHQLKMTQDQLIQREKIAALGHLIAGIAHEINTPLGAIHASVGNISHALDMSLEHLPHLFQTLSPERQAEFLTLLREALGTKVSISSRESRALRKELKATLESYAISDADSIAKHLVNMGIYQDMTPYLALLRDEQNSEIIRTAYYLFMQKNNSANIEHAVDRVSKVVFALKNYIHYDQSGQKMFTQVTEGIDIVLTLYHSQLKHGIEVTTHYTPMPMIACYPDELKQVWTNLIHNAIQAMNGKGSLEIAVFPAPPSLESTADHSNSPPGRGKGWVAEDGQHLNVTNPPLPLPGGEFDEQRQGVIVRITDSGCGIPDEIKARIFEPFFTTKPAGEGSGLGLDIVKKIVERHEGSITVDSQPGKTSFQVFLPA